MPSRSLGARRAEAAPAASFEDAVTERLRAVPPRVEAVRGTVRTVVGEGVGEEGGEAMAEHGRELDALFDQYEAAKHEAATYRQNFEAQVADIRAEKTKDPIKRQLQVATIAYLKCNQDVYEKRVHDLVAEIVRELREMVEGERSTQGRPSHKAEATLQKIEAEFAVMDPDLGEKSIVEFQELEEQAYKKFQAAYKQSQLSGAVMSGVIERVEANAGPVMEPATVVVEQVPTTVAYPPPPPEKPRKPAITLAAEVKEETPPDEAAHEVEQLIQDFEVAKMELTNVEAEIHDRLKARAGEQLDPNSPEAKYLQYLYARQNVLLKHTIEYGNVLLEDLRDIMQEQAGTRNAELAELKARSVERDLAEVRVRYSEEFLKRIDETSAVDFLAQQGQAWDRYGGKEAFYVPQAEEKVREELEEGTEEERGVAELIRRYEQAKEQAKANDRELEYLNDQVERMDERDPQTTLLLAYLGYLYYRQMVLEKQRFDAGTAVLNALDEFERREMRRPEGVSETVQLKMRRVEREMREWEKGSEKKFVEEMHELSLSDLEAKRDAALAEFMRTHRRADRGAREALGVAAALAVEARGDRGATQAPEAFVDRSGALHPEVLVAGTARTRDRGPSDGDGLTPEELAAVGGAGTRLRQMIRDTSGSMGKKADAVWAKIKGAGVFGFKTLGFLLAYGSYRLAKFALDTSDKILTFFIEGMTGKGGKGGGGEKHVAPKPAAPKAESHSGGHDKGHH